MLEPADDGELLIGDARWRRWRTPRAFVYGTGRTADPVGLLDTIMRRAERSGLPVESINSEFDSAQFELTLEVDEAMKAADDAFLFRVLAREVALEHGLDLTFLGKPFAGISGSGLHVNFSLVTPDQGNAFDDPPQRRRAGTSCVAVPRRPGRAPPLPHRAVRANGERLPPSAARRAVRVLGHVGS